ncbi:hypothetical protein L0P53_13720, partial [Holdemanella sp. DFI.5.21]|nr:hypothetical protein [Holdemanella sp. DFI.5.21]
LQSPSAVILEPPKIKSDTISTVSSSIALSEIKTSTQKWETKHEPQTNGSYKIRQIIIKIMEYTHIHIHP